MDSALAQKAINQALGGNWREAIKTNKEILSANPQNTDALNRLSRAYSEIGDIGKAKKTAQKVLKVNPYDTIAKKSLQKWENLKKGSTYVTHSVNPDLFLEESGKTKITTLLHLGDYNKVIAKLDCGDKVNLDGRSHRLSVTTEDGKYVGRLPDDLSARLKKFINFGNVYIAFVKAVSKNEVKIFIRESKRSDKLKDMPTFTSEKINYVTFTPPELVHEDGPEVVNDEAEE